MIPRIAPVDTNWDRPVLSVMLPVRDPGPHLEEALGSVLAQGLHHGDAQIAVVDDGSAHDVERRIRALDPHCRVEYHRFDQPAGISGNLNRTIGLARGHLVHLLHQDDFVLPGFYARMRRAFERSPMAGMAFCRTRIVDGSGRCIKRSSGPQLWSGIAKGWVAKISTRQRVQAPSAIVARTAYEAVGGYREDLRLALDWEMWVRIAVRYPVWFESRALAAFRRHPHSETARLRNRLLAWPDVCHAIRLNGEHCRECGHADLTAESARWYARSAMREAVRDYAAGRIDSARHTLAQCREIIPLACGTRMHRSLERRLESIEARTRLLHAS